MIIIIYAQHIIIFYLYNNILILFFTKWRVPGSHFTEIGKALLSADKVGLAVLWHKSEQCFVVGKEEKSGKLCCTSTKRCRKSVGAKSCTEDCLTVYNLNSDRLKSVHVWDNRSVLEPMFCLIVLNIIDVYPIWPTTLNASNCTSAVWVRQFLSREPWRPRGDRHTGLIRSHSMSG